MSSVWEQISDKYKLSRSDKEIQTGVLIIGGGMAGISYALVEANTICGGITKNTTAKITSQYGLIYDKIIKKYGIERAKQYLAVNETTLNKYRDLCKDIDCDFEEKDSYVYSIDNRQKI